MRRNKDLSHDHEWLREPTVDWDEDIFVTWDCNWAEVTSAVTSERHDETFYGYGAECAATKTAVYNLVIDVIGCASTQSITAEPLVDDDPTGPYGTIEETHVSWDSETAARVCEKLHTHHSTELIETVEQSVTDPYSVPIETDGVRVKLGGDRYYAYGELDKTYVDEDWE